MSKLFQFIFFLVFAPLIGYAAIAMLGSHYTASPLVQLIGPGGRPSVCADRSRPYFIQHETTLRGISEKLIASERFTDIWITKSSDPNDWILRYIDDEADVYEDVEATKEEVDLFLPLFNRLETNDFQSPVFFQQNDESVAAFQSLSTCGPSIFDWIKFRLRLGEPTKGRPHAFAIAYLYWKDGVQGISSCPEPLPEFEGTLLCEVKLDKNWTWSSRWAPERVLNMLDKQRNEP